MRLIDADRLINLSERYETFIDRKSVETAPTVEAIPLEFLEYMLKEDDVPKPMKDSIKAFIIAFKCFNLLDDIWPGGSKNGQQ